MGRVWEVEGCKLSFACGEATSLGIGKQTITFLKSRKQSTFSFFSFIFLFCPPPFFFLSSRRSIFILEVSEKELPYYHKTACLVLLLDNNSSPCGVLMRFPRRESWRTDLKHNLYLRNQLLCCHSYLTRWESIRLYLQAYSHWWRDLSKFPCLSQQDKAF